MIALQVIIARNIVPPKKQVDETIYDLYYFDRAPHRGRVPAFAAAGAGDLPGLPGGGCAPAADSAVRPRCARLRSADRGPGDGRAGRDHVTRARAGRRAGR